MIGKTGLAVASSNDIDHGWFAKRQLSLNPLINNKVNSSNLRTISWCLEAACDFDWRWVLKTESFSWLIIAIIIKFDFTER